MRKTVMIALGALLISGSAIQMASAATENHTRKAHQAQVATNDQFLNANNSSASGAKASCQNREPGNPYNPQTDYTGWSSWRESGAWDSRNDCW
jgi:hypothetical protein